MFLTTSNGIQISDSLLHSYFSDIFENSGFKFLTKSKSLNRYLLFKIKSKAVNGSDRLPLTYVCIFPLDFTLEIIISRNFLS